MYEIANSTASQCTETLREHRCVYVAGHEGGCWNGVRGMTAVSWGKVPKFLLRLHHREMPIS